MGTPGAGKDLSSLQIQGLSHGIFNLLHVRVRQLAGGLAGAAVGHQQEQRDAGAVPRETVPVYTAPASADAPMIVQSPPLIPATQPLENIPAQPAPGAVWIAGHYNFTGTSYAWEPGRWETPPAGMSAWVPPSWQPQGNGYVYVRGHWQ